jgi:Coenzyme PQQ synthesis protein D (PqqD)
MRLWMSECARGTVFHIFSAMLESPGKRNPLLKIAEGVRSTHNRDGAVVLDIHHGQMFTLNLVGSKILEMLERGCPETQMVEEITRKFRIRPDIVERDVREFLECLEKHRLVEVRVQDSGA